MVVAELKENIQICFEEERQRLEAEIRQLRDILSRLDPKTVPEQKCLSPEAHRIWVKLNTVCIRAADALGAVRKE